MRKMIRSVFLYRIKILSCSYIFCSFLYLLNYIIFYYNKNLSFGLLYSEFIGLSILAFLLFSQLFFPKRFFLWINNTWIFISFALFYIDLICWIIFQSPLSASMINTAIETNYREALSFFKLYFSPKIVVYSFLYIIFSYLILTFTKYVTNNFKKICGSIFLAISAIGLYFFLKIGVSYFTDMSKCQYRNEMVSILPIRFTCETYRVFSKKREGINLFGYTKLFKSAHLDTNGDEIKKIVLILGESTQRNHMELYGYKKNTSSFTKQISKDNLIVFQDVISPHAQTNLSLQKILTFQNYENAKTKEWYEYNNLINIFNSINYETVWISNQDINSSIGSNDGMAKLSSRNFFISSYKRWYDEAFFDENLLPYIKNNINNEKQLFVIHLMGTHATYGNRYPKSFNFFSNSIFQGIKNQIEKYDNAVRYNDYIVDQIFKIFSYQDAIVFFVSDHGEEVLELSDNFIGHSDDRISRFMVEIPMLVYVSKAFIHLHPNAYKSLKESVDRPYMIDDLIHTIIDIANIEIDNFESTRSVINKNFNKDRKRIVGDGRRGGG